MRRQDKKVAVVTGGAQGIGKAVSHRLSAEGALVVIADINSERGEITREEICSRGRKAIFLQADIAQVDQIFRMTQQVVEQAGRIDILVNCAGILQNREFLDVTEQDWNRIIDVNQRGVAFACQAVARQMVAQVPEDVRRAGRADRSYGKIVNFSSISGRRGRAHQIHYASTKAAIISITQSIALALAPYNINVNAISPSVVATAMWQQADREKSELLGLPPGKALKDYIETIPLKRAGTGEDMAAAVAFLCSHEADYITGQTINVDGGYEMD